MVSIQILDKPKINLNHPQFFKKHPTSCRTYRSNGVQLQDQLRQSLIVLQAIEKGHCTSWGGKLNPNKLGRISGNRKDGKKDG